MPHASFENLNLKVAFLVNVFLPSAFSKRQISKSELLTWASDRGLSNDEQKI